MTAAYAFYAVFFIGYLGAVIAVLIRRYVQSTPRERMASGLNVILFGAVAGVVPSIVAGVMRRLAPSVTLPGSEYYIVAVILIPLSFVIAMTKKPVRPAP